MKRRILNYLNLLALVTLVGLTGCSDDQNDTQDNGGIVGEATARLNLSFSQQPGLKAADPNNATSGELTFNLVDVYIYHGNAFEKRVTLPAADFEEAAPGSNVWVLKKEKLIKVVPGTKNVYAGVNLPTEFSQFRVANTPFYQTGLDDLNSDGFAMFSKNVVSATVAMNDTASVIIPVDRLLAKVVVHSETGGNTIPEGTFSDLKFDLNNNNKAFYLFQQSSGGFVVDPNYDWSTTDYSADFLSGTSFLNVEAAPTTYSNYTNVKYTLENTTKYTVGQAGAKQRKTSTYAVVSAIFTPNTVIDAVSGASSAGVKGTTFYELQYEGGEILYLTAPGYPQVNDYATANANSRTFRIKTYTNGVCYYNVFLGKNGAYEVLRNYFYVINVTKIDELGSPEIGIIPDEPIENETYLQITVDVQPWSTDIQNVVLEN